MNRPNFDGADVRKISRILASRIEHDIDAEIADYVEELTQYIDYLEDIVDKVVADYDELKFQLDKNEK